VTAGREFRLGRFRVRPQTRELLGPGGTVRLKPRAMDVLVDLASHPGDLRTRDEVLASVWGDLAVGEEVLTHCIWELRKALGDDKHEPCFIETLHRSGYRLIANVAPVTDITPDTPIRSRELTMLAGRVQRFWIEQVLEASLSDEERVAIGREERADLVRHPWAEEGEIVAVPPRRAVPDWESILTTFERMGEALLMAGAAGSGKTMALLQLAKLALARARHDPSAPIPVVLPLASWGERALPLERWIGSEIRARYFLPHHLAAEWLASGTLLLLLDGLDEVRAARRGGCIAAINRFRREQPVTPLAITCREDEYTSAGERLELDGAIGLLPFTPSQVAATLPRSDGMQQLVTSPLLLGLARRVLVTETVPTVPALFRQLVHDSLRQERGGYGERESVQWLSRLARAMLDRNRTVLAVEELQPSWLITSSSRAAYVLLTRMLMGLVIGLSAASFFAIAAGRLDFILPLVADALAGALGLAVLDGFLLGHPRAGSTGAYALLVCGAVGLSVLASHVARGLGALFAAPLLHALLFALIAARPLATVSFDRDIRPVEALTWSWANALRGWLGIGTLTWILLLIGRTTGLWPARAASSLFSTLPNSFFFALVPALLFGLEPGAVEGKTRPNHGMWLSARNAMFSGALASIGCAAGVFAGAIVRRAGWLGAVRFLGADLTPGLPLLLATICWFAPLAALRFGALDLLKHVVLRLLLSRQGLCPLRFPRFLEHATRRGLLRRAGGSYLFFHSTLMEYLGGSERD
jgi:DNA-binding winged helix-turn-helix (wHTH) protein